MSTATFPRTGTQTKVVQARNVSKIFKRDAFEVKALDDVSIEIASGEFLALMGPSGSGKTTLLNMIAAIDRPTSGDLLVLGENIFRFSDSQSAHWRNEHIGYVFQTFNLIPVLTAFENVELPLLLTKLNSQQRRDHVMTALKLVGLEERVHHLPKQLSGGQEQRVAIARAIVSDPTLILADEPTGDLDSNSATEILEILKRLNEDFHKTVVMVTHDPHAASYAHTTRHLEKGTLKPASSGTGASGGSVRSLTAADAAVLLAYANRVVFVPGYGLAVAQAQHVARELADLLEARRIDVRYAIHPVAGRMPGHMNVLLAEADVPYPQLYEMERINPEFARTDVVLVVGANDVTNPAARTSPESPIYGMPILEVDRAKQVIVLKRSLGTGFAGVDNALYYEPNCSMLFGDAKASLNALVAAVAAL
jgi:putative ABC transport system ATP-binding protein